MRLNKLQLTQCQLQHEIVSTYTVHQACLNRHPLLELKNMRVILDLFVTFCKILVCRMLKALTLELTAWSPMYVLGKLPCPLRTFS